MQIPSSICDLVPADHAMPLGPCFVIGVAVLFPTDAGREREASVLIALRRGASLGVLANKPDESDAIFAKHVLIASEDRRYWLYRARTLQVARAVLALSVRPKGFTASQLAEHVRRQTNAAPKDYGPRQAAYDLKKFRGKELVRLVGKTRRHEPTRNGLTMISGLIVLRERVLEPLIRSTFNRESDSPVANPTSLDQRYRGIRGTD